MINSLLPRVPYYPSLPYYLRSRSITDEFDKLVSLLCADRLKELIPKSCLEFILAQEKDGWLKHDELAHSIDIYMSSHDVDGNPCRTGGSAFKRDNRGPKDSKSSEPSHVSKNGHEGEAKLVNKLNKEEAMRKGLCFVCSEPGHTAKNCKKRQIATGSKRPVHSSACTAQLSPHSSVCRANYPQPAEPGNERFSQRV